jgi:hypothetical protein
VLLESKRTHCQCTGSRILEATTPTDAVFPENSILGLTSFAPETTGTDEEFDYSFGVYGASRGLSCPLANELVGLLSDRQGMDQRVRDFADKPFQKMNKLFLSVICGGTGLNKNANGEVPESEGVSKAVRPWILVSCRRDSTGMRA